VLQSVAECCRVLQCVAVCCRVLQALLCVAVCCSVLQCVAVCSFLRRGIGHDSNDANTRIFRQDSVDEYLRHHRRSVVPENNAKRIDELNVSVGLQS